MNTQFVDDAALLLADPVANTDEARIHAALTHLRAHAPVSWVDAPGYNPFWAITKHADIIAVERANDIFTNSPRPVLIKAEMDVSHADVGISTLIHLDGPEHRDLRAIGADWFRPKAMRALQTRIEELARIYVDRMAHVGPECDVVQEVAVNFPLYVIQSLLGVPEEDFPLMLRLTQELLGAEDNELQRKDPESNVASLVEMFQYFTALTAAWREHPTDGLGSAIANASINGAPLSDIDTVSYYVIIATAGHDTTTATIAGGLHALVEHPDELARLKANPELMGLAAEEMIRWVTPVRAFMRTAQQDTQIRGVPIRAGESLLLSYPSGNRDEDVFADPFRFDVAREPNKHVAFGHGAHFCLGAALARMEIKSFFNELLPRLDSIEMAGTAEQTASTFVGGLKHLPVKYSIRTR